MAGFQVTTHGRFSSDRRGYSPSLQTVVLVKRSDPRSGTITYRLTNIRRDDPSAILFTVPLDYKMLDQLGREILRDRRIGERASAVSNQNSCALC